MRWRSAENQPVRSHVEVISCTLKLFSNDCSSCDACRKPPSNTPSTLWIYIQIMWHAGANDVRGCSLPYEICCRNS